MNPQKVLITGGAGFIAYHLTESLLRDGVPVVSFDNFDPYYPRELKEKNLADLRKLSQELNVPFEFREMDFLNPGALKELPAGIDGIVHLGAKAGVRPSLIDPAGYMRTNIEGSINLLEWARARDIKGFVFGSSSSVYGEDSAPPFREDSLCLKPVSPYAASKRAGELLCQTYSHLYGMKIASLRFFTVYGPRQRPDLVIRKFIEATQENRGITLFGDGESARDYTFVTDIVAGIRAALRKVTSETKPFHEIYNLGGHKTTSLRRLVELLETSLGQEPKKTWDEAQPGDVRLTYADVSKSQKELGYSPAVPIEMGLKKAVEWHQNFRKNF